MSDPSAKKEGLSASSATLRLSDRLALRPAEAAAALGISERKLREMLPQLPHIRVNGVVLLPVDSLTRWLDRHAEEQMAQVGSKAAKILEKMAG